MSKCNNKKNKKSLLRTNTSKKYPFLGKKVARHSSYAQKNVFNTINVSLDLLIHCLPDKNKLDILSIFYWIKSISGSSSIKCDTNTLSGLSSGMMISKDKLRKIMSDDLFKRLISINKEKGMVVAKRFVTSGRQIRMVVTDMDIPMEDNRLSYLASVPRSYKDTHTDLMSIKLISDINDQQKAVSTVKGDVVRGIRKKNNDIDIYTGKSMRTIAMDMYCSVSKAREVLNRLIRRGYITKKIRRQDLFGVGDNTGTGIDKKRMREDIASSYNTRNGKIINGKLATYIQFSNEYHLSGYLEGKKRMRINRRCLGNERIVNKDRDIYDAYLPDISRGGEVSCVETYDVSDGTITNVPTTTLVRGNGLNISDDIRRIQERQDRLIANSSKWVNRLMRGNGLSGKQTVCYPGGFSALKICNKINNIMSSSYSLENGSVRRMSSKEAFDIIKEREVDMTISHVVSTYQLDDIIMAAKNDINMMTDAIRTRRDNNLSSRGYRIVGGIGIDTGHDSNRSYDIVNVTISPNQGFDPAHVMVDNGPALSGGVGPVRDTGARPHDNSPWCDSQEGCTVRRGTPEWLTEMYRTS